MSPLMMHQKRIAHSIRSARLTRVPDDPLATPFSYYPLSLSLCLCASQTIFSSGNSKERNSTLPFFLLSQSKSGTFTAQRNNCARARFKYLVP